MCDVGVTTYGIIGVACIIVEGVMSDVRCNGGYAIGVPCERRYDARCAVASVQKAYPVVYSV